MVKFPNDITDFGSQCNGEASKSSPPMSFNRKLTIKRGNLLSKNCFFIAYVLRIFPRKNKNNNVIQILKKTGKHTLNKVSCFNGSQWNS